MPLRDGDGDGLIYDGTPMERPAFVEFDPATGRFTAKWLSSPEAKRKRVLRNKANKKKRKLPPPSRPDHPVTLEALGLLTDADLAHYGLHPARRGDLVVKLRRRWPKGAPGGMGGKFMPDVHGERTSGARRQALRQAHVRRKAIRLGEYKDPTSFYGKLAEAAKSGGITIDPVSGKIPRKGYSVAVRPVSPYALKLRPEEVDADVVRNWMRDPGVSDALSKSGRKAGAWFDADETGFVYFDVVQLVPEDKLDDAKALGRKRNQLSIANLKAINEGDWDNAIIDTGGTGEVKRGRKQRPSRYTATGSLAKAAPRLVLFDPSDDPDEVVRKIKRQPVEKRRIWIPAIPGKRKAHWRRIEGKGDLGRIGTRQPGKTRAAVENAKLEAAGESVRGATFHEGSTVAKRMRPSKDEKHRAAQLERIRKVAGFEDATDMDDVLDRMTENVRSLTSEASHLNRSYHSKWYERANAEQLEWADDYDVDPDVVHAMVAVLSAGRDWESNRSQALAILESLHENPVIDERTVRRANKLRNKKAGRIRYTRGEHRTLKQFGLGEQAALVRAMNPDLMSAEKTKTGKNKKAIWQSESNISKAISIYHDPTRDNVSAQLGYAHKIRSFYNNMRDPHNKEGWDDVTIDTHAFGIALGIPITQTSPEINTSKGSLALLSRPSSVKEGISGVYDVAVEAYRRVAKEIGVEPSQLQSITWMQWKEKYDPVSRRTVQEQVRQQRRRVSKSSIGYMPTRIKGVEWRWGDEPDVNSDPDDESYGVAPWRRSPRSWPSSQVSSPKSTPTSA